MCNFSHLVSALGQFIHLVGVSRHSSAPLATSPKQKKNQTNRNNSVQSIYSTITQSNTHFSSSVYQRCVLDVGETGVAVSFNNGQLSSNEGRSAFKLLTLSVCVCARACVFCVRGGEDKVSRLTSLTHRSDRCTRAEKRRNADICCSLWLNLEFTHIFN